MSIATVAPNPTSAEPIPNTANAILECARSIVPRLRESSAVIEENRRLPPSIVKLLRQSGVFRAAMPRSWGGPELSSVQQTQLIETIATGDVSAAWCSMIGMDSGIYSGFLSEDVARKLYPRLDMATSGWIHPQGRADRVSGGFLVSGNWKFASGITHCDVLVAGCLVYQDGEPEPDPVSGADRPLRSCGCSRVTHRSISSRWSLRRST
jgi:alkylation response protein AidB-like acyl-CoA dehydrogenase